MPEQELKRISHWHESQRCDNYFRLNGFGLLWSQSRHCKVAVHIELGLRRRRRRWLMMNDRWNPPALTLFRLCSVISWSDKIMIVSLSSGCPYFFSVREMNDEEICRRFLDDLRCHHFAMLFFIYLKRRIHHINNVAAAHHGSSIFMWCNLISLREMMLLKIMRIIRILFSSSSSLFSLMWA